MSVNAGYFRLNIGYTTCQGILCSVISILSLYSISLYSISDLCISYILCLTFQVLFLYNCILFLLLAWRYHHSLINIINQSINLSHSLSIVLLLHPSSLLSTFISCSFGTIRKRLTSFREPARYQTKDATTPRVRLIVFSLSHWW